MEAVEFFKTGVEKLKRGQLDDAINQLKTAVVLDSSNWQCHSYLGIAFAQKGQKDKAIMELQKACELNVGNPLVHFNLGMAFMDCGKTDEARDCLQRALIMDPNYQKAKDALSRLYVPGSRKPDTSMHQPHPEPKPKTRQEPLKLEPGPEVKADAEPTPEPAEGSVPIMEALKLEPRDYPHVNFDRCPVCKIEIPDGHPPVKCRCEYDLTPLIHGYIVKDLSSTKDRYVCAACRVEIVNFKTTSCISCGMNWKTGLGPDGEPMLETLPADYQPPDDEPKKVNLKGLFAKLKKHP